MDEKPQKAQPWKTLIYGFHDSRRVYGHDSHRVFDHGNHRVFDNHHDDDRCDSRHSVYDRDSRRGNSPSPLLYTSSPDGNPNAALTAFTFFGLVTRVFPKPPPKRAGSHLRTVRPLSTSTISVRSSRRERFKRYRLEGGCANHGVRRLQIVVVCVLYEGIAARLALEVFHDDEILDRTVLLAHFAKTAFRSEI